MPERRAFSVSLFARHRGRVLLIRHARLGAWLPVGGEIEPGETPLEAARRELLEETGLVGTFTARMSASGGGVGSVDGTPPGLLGYEEHRAGSKGLHLNFAFVVDVESDRVVSNGEFAEHRWIADVAELESLDAPRNVRELAALALRAAGATASGAPLDMPLIKLARAWLAAFNGRDLEGLLALYADDAVHLSPKLRARRPETGGLVRGKAALREWWADSFARLPGLHYAERAITASAADSGDSGDERVLLEYERTLPGEEALAVAELFVVRGGRIVESRVYHG